MGPIRRVLAVFTAAEPQQRGERRGLVLSFRPTRARLGADHIEDFADLGPELTVPAVAGLGKVLRILRAARLARPEPPQTLVGEEARAAALLDPARGTVLRLGVRPRTQVRFLAWTDSGVQCVDDVVEVLESPVAYLVLRRDGQRPVSVERSSVIRQRTEVERWFEVLEIERA